MEKIKNEKSIPEVYYGMHFCPGIAEYAEPGAEPYRIFVSEDTIRKMNKSFDGCPLYVDHVDEVDLDNLKHQMDGVVVRSFYNAADGKTWAEFVAITDDAKQKIAQGWGLSNAYIPTQFGSGGLWNGADYAKEVLDGKFEHLAIVHDPRYESKILTRDQFKEYNESLESELKKLQNSNNDQKEKTMGLKFFKKTKVENAIDESMMIELPKSKIEMPLLQIVNELDAIKNMHGYANGDHMVKLNESEEMTINDLIKRCNDMSKKMEEMEAMKNDEDAGDNKDADIESMDNEEDDKDREDEIEKHKKNDDEEQDLEYAKKKTIGNSADKKAPSQKDKKHFDKLKNAQSLASKEVAVVNVLEDRVQLGSELYGSGR